MKKVVLIFAMIVIAISVFGQVRKAPACTTTKYPDLYTGAGGYYNNPAEYYAVTMTVPFANVKETKSGVYFSITHPVVGNECMETIDFVPDSDMETLQKIFDELKKRKDKNEIIQKMDISIKIEYIKGKTDGVWRVSSIGFPNNFQI